MAVNSEAGGLVSTELSVAVTLETGVSVVVVVADTSSVELEFSVLNIKSNAIIIIAAITRPMNHLILAP